jgi:hypothetical protein
MAAEILEDRQGRCKHSRIAAAGDVCRDLVVEHCLSCIAALAVQLDPQRGRERLPPDPVRCPLEIPGFGDSQPRQGRRLASARDRALTVGSDQDRGSIKTIRTILAGAQIRVHGGTPSVGETEHARDNAHCG